MTSARAVTALPAQAVVAYPWLSGKIDCDRLTAEFDIRE
jgi:hypothetical protein